MAQTPTTNYTEEAVLVRQAQAGSQAAFDELSSRYRGALLAMTFMRTSNREDADDLVQDILTTAWRKIGSLQDARSFAAWIKVICANACNSWYRRRRPWPESLREAEHPGAEALFQPDPLDVLLEREKQRDWRRALETLPADNRVALLMHIWGDASYQEIADFFQVPITTIEGRIHRAKTRLRYILRHDGAQLLNEPVRRFPNQEDSL